MQRIIAKGVCPSPKRTARVVPVAGVSESPPRLNLPLVHYPLHRLRERVGSARRDIDRHPDRRGPGLIPCPSSGWQLAVTVQLEQRS